MNKFIKVEDLADKVYLMMINDKLSANFERQKCGKR